MKTKMNIGTATRMVAVLLLGLIPALLFSQQVIRFKSGNTYQVKIIKKTADSITYKPVTNPDLMLTAPLQEVDTIWANATEYPGYELQKQKEYLEGKVRHYSNLTTGGVIMTVAGGALMIGGLTINPSTGSTFNEEANKFFGKIALTTVGLGFTAAGMAVMINGIVHSQKFKEQLKKVNLDLKYTPAGPGISLRYKF
jgi:hypothetical protein